MLYSSNILAEEVAAGAKDEAYKVRKFFVKYANSSYWKCHWIDELQVIIPPNHWRIEKKRKSISENQLRKGCADPSGS